MTWFFRNVATSIALGTLLGMGIILVVRRHEAGEIVLPHLQPQQPHSDRTVLYTWRGLAERTVAL